MNRLSENLRKRRKSLNLTQQDIALSLNISNKAVSKWETGECFPDTSQLLPLAKLLGLTVDQLLGGNGENEETKNVEKIVKESIISVEKEKKPWLKFLVLALCTAILGVLFFFLFINTFNSGYYDVDMWALGILITFVTLSVLFLIIALIVYCVRPKKDKQ